MTMIDSAGCSSPILADRFECVRELGHGGLAAVYLARDRLLDRECAVKLIHEHLAGDPTIVGRFERELAMNRLVRHPGVVEYYELFTAGPRAFLSLEYMAGGDLRTRILRHGALPVAAAIDIGDVILDALSVAHGQGVIHGDIKPQNILFSGDGAAKLCDFGLSRLASAERRSLGSIDAGTPEYSPPELIQGRTCDARGDLYAFGVTLYEILCGRLPYKANSALEILRAHLTAEPTAPRELRPELSPELEAVVLRALSKDPLDRFQSAAQFRQALLACRRASPASSVPVTVPVPAAGGAGADRPAAGGRAVGHAGGAVYCGRCGRRVSRLLPYCFYCGRDVPRLSAAAPKTARSSVYILGPGAPATKFEAMDRKRLLELLDACGADAAALRKKLPRFPFVLARGVTPLAASQLAEAAAGLGLEAAYGPSPGKASVVASSGATAAPPDAAGRFGKKEWTMTGRILAVALGSMSGLWGNIVRVFDEPKVGLAILSGIAVVAVGSAIVVSITGSRRPMAAPADPDAEDGDWLRAQELLRPLRGALSAPSLRDLAAAVSLKLERFLEDGALRGRYADEADAFMEDLDAWAGLCLAAQEIERYLQGRPESAIVDALREAEARQDVGREGAASGAAFVPSPDALRHELAARRELERSYNYFLDRILAFNTGLDALILAEARSLERGLGNEARLFDERIARARSLLPAQTDGVAS